MVSQLIHSIRTLQIASQLKTRGSLVDTNNNYANNDDTKGGNNVSKLCEVFYQLLATAERNIISSDILLSLPSLPTNITLPQMVTNPTYLFLGNITNLYLFTGNRN